MIRKLVLAIFASITFASPVFAGWSVQNGTTGFTIIGTHSEIIGGLPAFDIYFIANDQVIMIGNLDKPDMQSLSNKFRDAYNTGKKVYYGRNNTRNSDASYWYTWNSPTNAIYTVTFYRIYSGDGTLIRFK